MIDRTRLMFDEDVTVNRIIGEVGADLLAQGSCVLARA
jgi:hypothetical protein